MEERCVIAHSFRVFIHAWLLHCFKACGKAEHHSQRLYGRRKLPHGDWEAKRTGINISFKNIPQMT
jgi:hypothetical protein